MAQIDTAARKRMRSNNLYVKLIICILFLSLVISLTANALLIEQDPSQIQQQNKSTQLTSGDKRFSKDPIYGTDPSDNQNDTKLDLGPARKYRSKNAIDVILVVIDTARADYLQPYNTWRLTSPFISAVAKQGIVFTNAYSTSGWTVPAMASMMTGLYPSQHGIVSSSNEELKEIIQQELPQEAVTLAETLKDNGYRTFGVSTNLHLTPRFGFAQGFDVFAGDRFAFKPFPQIAVDSMSDQIRKSDKFFLWLHYFDAHFPYYERAPWFHRWNDSVYHTADELCFDAAAQLYRMEKSLPLNSRVPSKDLSLLTDYVGSFSKNPLNLFFGLPVLIKASGEEGANAEYTKYLRAAYQSELRSIDCDMEKLLEGLGIDDQTLLIITADHGEEFFEHGGLGHHMESLYQELIRVPLIVRLPYSRNKGKTIHTPVSIVDIMPTLLELLDIPQPGKLAGQSFAHLMENGDTGKADRDVLSERTLPTGEEIRSLIRFPWKYIHHFSTDRGELYNLEQDQGERKDLSINKYERALDMRTWLAQWTSRTKPNWRESRSVEVTAEEFMKLQALGYVGTSNIPDGIKHK